LLALGLGLEAMVTLLTPRFIPFFMVLWIIVNVCGVFFPIEVLPIVFRYVYATPFYNISNATRTILFGTRNQLDLNFGVLFVWIGISLVTISLFQTMVRRKQVRAWRAQVEKERKEETGEENSANTDVGMAGGV